MQKHSSPPGKWQSYDAGSLLSNGDLNWSFSNSNETFSINNLVSTEGTMTVVDVGMGNTSSNVVIPTRTSSSSTYLSASDIMQKGSMPKR